MRNLLVLLCLFLLTSLSAQRKQLPIVLASSDLLDIREGGEFRPGAWSLVPDLKPDVYTSNQIGSTVTFYTDLDSISYLIHPDSVYDFVVLLNGVDSAYTQIRYQPSYLDVLRGAEAFDYDDQTAIPEFVYQDSSATELRKLRTAFNLDSIAGGGNEISRVLNVLHWIHELIPHDGQHDNPVVKNAFSMINECRRDDRGLNCRGLSTVLNECYLALGFKSRFVTCMPKDSVFDDCHVINTVYSNDLDKWIWLDPSHDAYVMNERGELLGFAEVRQRLIDGAPLILNPSANWNRQSSTLKEYYLEIYMAKNLYRFSTPLRSEYNLETNAPGKTRAYVELLPLDAFQQSPKVERTVAKSSGVTFVTYKTNNPDHFWAAPK
ncbi:hypothetical protein CEQ90_17395 [Lewinellaceae bacterium SD302]|nr:hypothetical protein CEQ90_17395 [Lewinellaceae bacterium SD302]